MKKLDWFDFHERGNPNCPACVTPPTPCEHGDGWVHTQFDDHLGSLESKCDEVTCMPVQQAAVGE